MALKVMRDDIHKGAPVKAHWKVLAQVACSHRGRWEASGDDVARVAAIKEAQEVSDGLLHRINEAINATAPTLIPTFPGRRTEAEKDLISFFDLSRSQGEKPSIQDLLRRTLESRMRKISRTLKCHAAEKDPKGTGEFMRRIGRSLDSVRTDYIARQRIIALSKPDTASASTDLRNWNKQ
jgi:hypothetical protein